MQLCTEKEIIRRIMAGKRFEAQLDDRSLTVRINDFQPCIGTAIHHGHQLRSELMDLCALTPEERRYEEDPETGELISKLPIILQAEDSRYEYDLNRLPEECVYDTAWGRKVWRQPLTEKKKKTSREKHTRYYRILKALVETLESEFGVCVVYDVHSYNYQRLEGHTPVFNLGVDSIDMDTWGEDIHSIQEELRTIELADVETSVEINRVFFGRGYQARFIKDFFNDTLILPLEVKKIYMSETEGEIYPTVVETLERELGRILNDHAAGIIERKATG